MPPNVPQKQFFNTQDVVSPDVMLYYQKIIGDIDAFRSRFNGTTSNIQQTISLQNLDKVFVANEVNSTSPQESRCNAFFRMIGFPVVNASGSKIYSPGFDPDLNRNTNRTEQNLEIANSILGKLKTILDAREIYSKNSVNIFRNKDNNATATAMSAIYVRPFDKQLKEGIGPLEIDQQTFNVPGRVNIASNFSDPVKYSIESKHILKPFIVDPRIELTVTPAISRICVPFLEDKSKTQLSRSNYLKRPYIERVMRVRFNSRNVLSTPVNKEEINQFVADILSFIKTNSEITKPSLVEFTNNSLQSLHKSEIMIFAKFIKILEALVLELGNSFVTINRIMKDMNWKPTPNVNGPEFGSSLNAVDPADKNNKKIEKDIGELEIKKFLEETDFDLGVNDPDLGNFSFSNIDDIVFGSLKNVSQFYDRQLNTLNRRRDEAGATANELLQKIEIITGEFSGLGLLDIIAIQAALWVVSPGALLGLIDSVALGRMQKIAELKVDTSLRKSPIDALSEFEKKLSEIYVLINAFYQDIFNFGGKNKQ